VTDEEIKFRRLCIAAVSKLGDDNWQFGAVVYEGRTFDLLYINGMLSVTEPGFIPEPFDNVTLKRTIFDDALPGKTKGRDLSVYMEELYELVPLDALADL
jgi:hypothetical protein